MYFDEKFWIAVAFVLFISLVYKKLARFISSSLDKKLENIKAELKKAESLKKEANEIYENYKKEQEQAEQEAKDIIAQAQEYSQSLIKDGKKQIKKNTDTKLAEIEENLEIRRDEFVKSLRKEIVDNALDIVTKYLDKNKDKISKQSHEKSVKALEESSNS